MFLLSVVVDSCVVWRSSGPHSTALEETAVKPAAGVAMFTSLGNRLLDSVGRPDDWELMSSTDVVIADLAPDHHKFREIQAAMCGLSVSRVVRVQNLYLWGCYQLKMEECGARTACVAELELYHATDTKHVSSIIHGNFDWRRTKRCMYGKGVSFSPSPLYAERYCSDKCGPQRAMIVTRVIVGKTSVGFRSQLPEQGCDTSVSKHKIPKVYVKHADNEFYPAYVAYYTVDATAGHGVVWNHSSLLSADDDSVGRTGDIPDSLRLLHALSNSKFS